jgi:DHA2 family multidrug resistance protein
MYLQGLMGYPSLNSGMTMSPRGLGAVVSMAIVGIMVGKIDTRGLVIFGFLVLGYSVWAFGSINLGISASSITWPNIICGFSMGFCFVPLMSASMAELPNEQIGNASGVFNLARNIGGSIGISLTTTWVARGAQAHQALMVGHLSPYRYEYQRYFNSAAQLLGIYSDPATAQQQAHTLLYGVMVQQANLFAFVDTFRLLAFMCAFCIPIVLLLKPAKPGAGPIAIH